MSVPAPVADPVSAPSHYRGLSGLQAIEVTEAWRLGPHLTQAVDYLLRAGRKTLDPRQDLQKAAWYLRRAAALPIADLRFGVAANLPPHLQPEAVAVEFGLEPARAAVLLAIHRACHGRDPAPVATTLGLAADVLAGMADAWKPTPVWPAVHRESA